MRSVPALAAALAITAAAAPAHASLFWHFTFSDDADTASGTLTTDAFDSGTGGYAVTGISGSFDGTAITGLAPTGIGLYDASDNLLLPGPGFLDYGGIGFTLGSGGPEVLYAPEAGNFFEYDQATGLIDDFGSFSASLAVPEPVSLGMFAAGLASLALLRRKR